MNNDSTHAASNAVPEIYDKVTIRLHWATAALVSVLWLMGRTISFMPRGTLRIDMWSLHILLGAMLAGILVTRVIWRSTNGRKLPSTDRSTLELLAHAVHWLLYLLLATVVVLGVINVFTHAFPLFNMWRFPKIGGSDLRMEINNWHDLAANIIMAVALVHAVAALLHHYVIKDSVLRRMWPSRQQARQER